jgi:hypothetical protein
VAVIDRIGLLAERLAPVRAEGFFSEEIRVEIKQLQLCRTQNASYLWNCGRGAKTDVLEL